MASRSLRIVRCEESVAGILRELVDQAAAASESRG